MTSSETPYPKILFISHTPFSKTSNNGKTYSSLLKEWPKNSIAQIYFNESEEPDLDFCYKYFRITDRQILKGTLKLNKNKYCGNSFIQKTTLKTSDQFNNKLKNRFDFLLFRDILWSFGSWKTKELSIWLTTFNPDVIFFVGGASAFSYRITNWIQKLLNIPIITYFTDDYLLNPRREGIIKGLQYHYNTKPNILKMIKKASHCFVIGEMMAKDYEKIFKRKFTPVMNSIDVEDYTEKKYIINKTDEVIKLAYIGGLHLNRWNALSLLGDILLNIQLESDIVFQLDIYTMDKLSNEILSKLNRSPLKVIGPLKSNEINSTLIMYDVLVHIESEDSESRKATKYSVSTKIPEYLSSMIPILAYGPHEVASIKLIKENNIGLVFTDLDDYDFMKANFLEFITNEEKRLGFSKKGYQFATKHFDNTLIREKVKKIIIDIASKLNDKGT